MAKNLGGGVDLEKHKKVLIDEIGSMKYSLQSEF